MRSQTARWGITATTWRGRQPLHPIYTAPPRRPPQPQHPAREQAGGHFTRHATPHYARHADERLESIVGRRRRGEG
jgi:hypothetical protein